MMALLLFGKKYLCQLGDIMNHPFISDLSTKTLDELMDIITKLTKQQQFMFRVGKQDVVQQINMALNSYRAEYQKRQQEIWNKNNNSNLNKSIDIS